MNSHQEAWMINYLGQSINPKLFQMLEIPILRRHNKIRSNNSLDNLFLLSWSNKRAITRKRWDFLPVKLVKTISNRRRKNGKKTAFLSLPTLSVQ